MQTQACQPCAKRKVRCDKKEPCSNCQRRKQDLCVYADLSPTERIKQLEALVRNLEGGSETSIKAASATPLPVAPERLANANPQVQNGTNPIIVRENGVFNYLESSSWHGWTHKVDDNAAPIYASNGYPILPGTGSRALQSIICRDPYIDLVKKHPVPQDAATLWGVFYQRVHPVSKISFHQELEKLRASAIAQNGANEFTIEGQAFVFALYLLSVLSLTEDECSRMFGQKQSTLLLQYQLLCEQALAGCDFLGSSSMTTIEATLMYITAGIERMNVRSLWSLMGAVIRNAERCGLHRDGALLGLSPYETERRRRVWWQLQHIDMAVGVKSGSISLTLTAPWDTQLPLNIEDEDIDPHMREAPKEREGLTSMAPCLWTYWVLYEQRSFCRADGSTTGFSWAADKSLSRVEKDAFINRLEVGLNKRYLQYCDPIRPRDMLVQIVARSFISAMRRISLHPLAYCGRLSELSEDHRNNLLDVCMQALRYDVALRSVPSLNDYLWRFQHYFQWSALVYVLIEARRQFDKSKVLDIWALLSEVYGANPTLSDLAEDRRKSYAAELMIAAWRARDNIVSGRQIDTHGAPRKPAFLVDLESKLSQITEAGNAERSSKRKLDETAAVTPAVTKKAVPPTGLHMPDLPLENVLHDQLDLDAIGDIDFDVIDWSFWETIQL